MSLFEEDKTNQDTPENKSEDNTKEIKSEDNELTTLLANIKSEDGRQKYDSVPKALEALGHSQSFIKELQGRIKELEESVSEKDKELNSVTEKLTKVDTLEDVVNRLTAAQGNNEKPSELTEDAVRNLIESVYKNKEAENIASQNIAKVEQSLINKFGEKAKDVLLERAGALGLTTEAIKNLSATAPDAVLALVTGGTSTSTASPTTSSVHIPVTNKTDLGELKRPEKSVLRGIGTKDATALMREIKSHVYKQYDVS